VSHTVTRKVKLKLNDNAWNKIKRENDTQTDEEIINKLIENYFSTRNTIQENQNLKHENEEILDKEINLESDLAKYQKKVRKLERYITKYKKKYLKQKKNYQRLKNDFINLNNNQIIQEKIVYKKDDSTINDLREKRDKLIEKSHQYLEQLKDMELIKEQLKELKKLVDDWKRNNFAVICHNCSLNDSTQQKPYLEIIDSKTYFEYKANPGRFKRKNKLNNNYVIKEIPYSIEQ